MHRDEEIAVVVEREPRLLRRRRARRRLAVAARLVVGRWRQGREAPERRVGIGVTGAVTGEKLIDARDQSESRCQALARAIDQAAGQIVADVAHRDRRRAGERTMVAAGTEDRVGVGKAEPQAGDRVVSGDDGRVDGAGLIHLDARDAAHAHARCRCAGIELLHQRGIGARLRRQDDGALRASQGGEEQRDHEIAGVGTEPWRRTVANGRAHVELDEVAWSGEGAVERPERTPENGLRLREQVASRVRSARSSQGREPGDECGQDDADGVALGGSRHVGLLEVGERVVPGERAGSLPRRSLRRVHDI